MSNDNDLIRRGDVKQTYWKTHQEPDVAEFIEDINAIPAVSGEPFGYTNEKNLYVPHCTYILLTDEHKKLFTIKLYTTPQDQSLAKKYVDNSYTCGHCGYSGSCYGTGFSVPWCLNCQKNDKLMPNN